MNTTELCDRFRSDVLDQAAPFLWTDDDVFRYADAAQFMFSRLTGGIPDVTTEAVVSVPVFAGEEYADLHPSILHIREARLVSTGRPLALKNLLDAASPADDYGLFTPANEHRSGPLRGLVLGEEYNKVRWVGIPETADEVRLAVYRLPLAHLTDFDQPIELREEHHETLLHWMKHLAYSKPDVDTHDARKAADGKALFEQQCAQAKAEWERYKHKPRTIKYGGIGGTGEFGPIAVRRSW